MDELSSYIERPDDVLRHQWKAQDLVVWDNIALQHARDTFDPAYRRHLRRTQISTIKGSALRRARRAADPIQQIPADLGLHHPRDRIHRLSKRGVPDFRERDPVLLQQIDGIRNVRVHNRAPVREEVLAFFFFDDLC